MESTRSGKLKNKIKKYLNLIFLNNNTGLLLSILVLFVMLSLYSSNFLSNLNIYTMNRTIAIYIFIGLAQAATLVVGNMNLSVGAIGGLATITAGYFLEVLGMPGWIATIVALLIGIIAGAVNGIIITKLKINPFIVTLGTLFFYTGLVFGFTKGFPFDRIPGSYLITGKARLFEVPVLLYIGVIVLVLVFLLFRFSIVGRRMLAIGENPVASRFSGINNGSIIILNHMLSGLFAAAGGILYLSRIGKANPQTGQEWLVISFAIAIIGGTALNGGSINVIGIFLGAVLLVMIKNGLVLLQVNIYWEQAFLGIFILVALFIDRFRKVFTSEKEL